MINEQRHEKTCVWGFAPLFWLHSTIPLLPKSEISSYLLSSVAEQHAWFVSNNVGNPEDRFSHDAAHKSNGHFICSLLLTSLFSQRERES